MHSAELQSDSCSAKKSHALFCRHVLRVGRRGRADLLRRHEKLHAPQFPVRRLRARARRRPVVRLLARGRRRDQDVGRDGRPPARARRRRRESLDGRPRIARRRTIGAQRPSAITATGQSRRRDNRGGGAVAATGQSRRRGGRCDGTIAAAGRSRRRGNRGGGTVAAAGRSRRGAVGAEKRSRRRDNCGGGVVAATGRSRRRRADDGPRTRFMPGSLLRTGGSASR